jgi:hypothetical protein
MKTKTIGSNEYWIGEGSSMEQCFLFAIDMADELIDSMKITGGYDFDEEVLRITIHKDNKIYSFREQYPYSPPAWWDGIYCIDKAINEVDPSINAHFSSRGGYENEEDTITLTVN